MAPAVLAFDPIGRVRGVARPVHVAHPARDSGPILSARGVRVAPWHCGHALDQLEAQLDVWPAGVRGLGEAGLRVPVGAKEPFPEAPMADLVLHIHRELIHHLSEVCLLRDLYLHTKPATDGVTR